MLRRSREAIGRGQATPPAPARAAGGHDALGSARNKSPWQGRGYTSFIGVLRVGCEYVASAAAPAPAPRDTSDCEGPGRVSVTRQTRYCPDTPTTHTNTMILIHRLCRGFEGAPTRACRKAVRAEITRSACPTGPPATALRRPSSSTAASGFADSLRGPSSGRRSPSTLIERNHGLHTRATIEPPVREANTIGEMGRTHWRG